jgi:SAM-dependent methyltransferase
MKIINKVKYKLENYIKLFLLKKKYIKYKNGIGQNHPFNKFKTKLLGDVSEDPFEFFSHYDAYSYWLAEKMTNIGNDKKVLDLGNLKVTNAILSLTNDVSSLVLKDCEDKLSKVSYIIHDISRPLRFQDKYFDVFSSSVSLHLVGLGRYGDEVNPLTLINFIEELDRVMKNDSDLIFSISYGKNFLAFNEGWKFDIKTLKKLFNKWELIDWLIDNKSSNTIKLHNQRFTKDLSIIGWEDGEYRVIFLHFKRQMLSN